MTEPTLTCPTCRTEIKLTESLAAPLIADTRRRYETQLAQKEAEVAAREAAIREQREELAAARQAIDAEVASKLDQERGKIAAAEAQKAKRLVATDLDARAKEIADLTEVLKQRDAKLAEAQQAQADLIRKQRELDDAKREIDLTIQKQVQAELTAVRDQAKQETEAALSLRVREKEEQIASMQRQIEDLKRKAEQGSQQLQGEVQELALEALLRQRFASRPDRTGAQGRVRRRPHSAGGTGKKCAEFGPDTVISITERGEEGFAARVDFTRRLPAATIFSWLGTLWQLPR